MYTVKDISETRRKFWTVFGQYMKPIASATGESVNWLNYKTGISHIHFRLDVNAKKASIAIQLTNPDQAIRSIYYNRLLSLQAMLEDILKEKWTWQSDSQQQDGAVISRISKSLEGVNIMNEADWPVIISFLKPRIIGLDEFWGIAKEIIY
jgi:hypothetical protein